MISLIFPHVSNPENDAALDLKLRMLRDNTRCEYQALYLTSTCLNPDDVYPAWNWLASRAKYPILLWDNSDIVYATDWDVAIRKYIDDYDWLCLRLVECGAIGVATTNIHKPFGKTAAKFDRAGFESFCATDAAGRHPCEPDTFGWYSPSAFRKEWFLGKGGFPTEESFPYQNDEVFRDRVTAEGCRFCRIGSYAYHFQRQGENLKQRNDDWRQ
jgi:hypothetical protein